MTNKDLFFAIGDVQEKWLKEAESGVNKTSSKKNIIKLIIPFAACFAVLIASAFIWTNDKTDMPVLSKGDGKVTSESKDASEKEDSTGSADTPALSKGDGKVISDSKDASGREDSTGSTERTDISDKDSEGGKGDTHGEVGSNFFVIWALPKDRTIVTAGEKITDSEAQKYFAQNRESILSSFSESGVSADDLRISEKGYCHVSYTGKGGEKLTVKENFRDYLVYNGENLVAIITLVKENGKISSTPMFGASWISDYGKFLNSHKGEELVFVYSGTTELVITPDNTVYAPLLSPNGYDASIYFKGVEDPYETFYHSSDIYVP